MGTHLLPYFCKKALPWPELSSKPLTTINKQNECAKISVKDGRVLGCTHSILTLYHASWPRWLAQVIHPHGQISTDADLNFHGAWQTPDPRIFALHICTSSIFCLCQEIVPRCWDLGSLNCEGKLPCLVLELSRNTTKSLLVRLSQPKC